MGVIDEIRFKTLLKIYTGPLVSWVPGSSESFGPPRKRITCPEAGRVGLGKWTSTAPAEDRKLAPLKVVWGEKPNFGDMLSTSHPEQGVLVLNNARVRSAHGYAVTEQDHLLTDTTFFYNTRILDPVYKEWKLQPVKHVKGKTLNLLSFMAFGNYAHAILDALPRVEMFRKAGFSFSDVDHILLPKASGDDFAFLIGKLGIPMDKVMYVEEFDHLKCDVLIQPNFPGRQREAASWIPEFYRNLLGNSAGSKDKLLYVPRRGFKRNIENEPEILEILEGAGFIEVESDDPAERFRQYSEAKAVVGPHGAGLANILFSSPDTKVLELMPSDHQYPYWYTLSHSAQLDYYVLLGNSTEERKGKSEQATFSNFVVSPEGLKENLKAMELL